MAGKAKSTDEKLDCLVSSVALLTQEMKEVRSEMGALRGELGAMKQSVDQIEETVDRKVESLRTVLTSHIDNEVASAKGVLHDELRAHIDMSIQTTDSDVHELTQRLNKAEKTIERLSSYLDEPFDPDRSVIIYGLQPEENKTLDETVMTLLIDTLKVSAEPILTERVTSDSNKTGVVKVEFESVYDKVSVLKAKRNIPTTDGVRKITIKSAEGHDARVARLNNRFLLGKLNLTKEFMITSHGRIIPKDQDARGDRADDDVSAEGDEAGTAPTTDPHVGKWAIMEI